MIFPWITLGLVFTLPFIDPRRPFRLLHLDLIVLVVVGMGPLRTYLGGGQPIGSSVLTVLGLTYLAVRFLHAGFRPRRRREPLLPLVPARWLTVALVLLLGFRFGYFLEAESYVGDVGLATVAGADRIGKGDELYDARLDQTLWNHTDTYGPFTYLAYVPFEQLFPWEGGYGTPALDYRPEAGHLASISFDLLVLAGLMLLGRRLRPGGEGRLLGLALAWAWAAYPYTLAALRFSFNDALVTVLVLGSFLALPWAAGRGGLLGLAAATKFGPAILAPLFATGTGERRGRSWLLFSIAFVAAVAVTVIPMLPPGGLSEFWDRTLGYQDGRPGWNSIWGKFPDLDWLRTLMQVAVAGLAITLAFIPKRRSTLQVAALGAGISAAMQLTLNYWFSAYLLWFAPLAFAALFAAQDCRETRRAAVPGRWGRSRQPAQAPAEAIRA